jgi:hypothetical protein
VERRAEHPVRREAALSECEVAARAVTVARGGGAVTGGGVPAGGGVTVSRMAGAVAAVAVAAAVVAAAVRQRIGYRRRAPLELAHEDRRVNDIALRRGQLGDVGHEGHEGARR